MTDRARNAFAIVLCALLLMAFSATAWVATWKKSATVDEPGHLIAGWALVNFGDFRDDCEDPPLFQKMIALGLPRNLFSIDRRSPEWTSLVESIDAQSVEAFQALYHTPGVDADTLLKWERLRMTCVGALLGIVIAWWAWRLAGRVAGVFALAAFCFDPTVLAHAPLVKNDVPLALAVVLFMASVWLFGERATVWRFLSASLFMGVAAMMKFPGLLTIPIFAAALAIRSLIPQPWRITSRVASTFGQRIAVSAGAILGSLLIVWVFIWACYDFRFLPTPDSPGEYDFNAATQLLAKHQAFAASADPFNMRPGEIERYIQDWRVPPAARTILWANEHRLFPQTFLIGLLRVMGLSLARTAFICGQSSVSGWWYYFPLAILFKTPAATLVALATAGTVMIPWLRRLTAAQAWPICAAAVFPVIYLAVSMMENVDVGIRHMLPLYSFLFIFVGVAAAKAWTWAKGRGAIIALLLLAGLFAETACAYPDFIPFFNVFCGGARGGLKLLSESNIDWGQDLPALATWQSKHGDRPLFLLYWGSADPRYYRISYVNLPESAAPPDLTSSGPGRPVYAISAVVLTNPFMHGPEKEFLNSLLARQPIAVLGGSIYVFDSP